MCEAGGGEAVYDQLVRDVFIDPIRTVIVVDDEYPTLDSLAAKEVEEPSAWSGKVEEVRRVRDLLRFARSKDRPWLVDVHDGKNISSESEQGAAPYLHHSDLLVLDYHLEGNSGNGDKAIRILRDLAESDHFNMVIVHTNGYDGEIEDVIREIAISLTYSDDCLTLTEEESSSMDESLNTWEETDENIVSKLKSEITQESYLTARFIGKENFKKLLSLPEWQRIIGYYKERPKGVPVNVMVLAKWLLFEKQKELTKQLSPKKLGVVQVGKFDDGNWIQTEKLFITVVSKRFTPDQFEDKLMGAIRESYPSPHRLLLTKMRSEIEQRGLDAEATILGNRQIQAEWLSDFLTPNPIDKRTVIYNTISRHWEALGDQLRASINSFAEELHERFLPMGVDSVIESCGLDKKDVGTADTLRHFNCFSSTKPIDRSHLTTGHVLQIDFGEERPQRWICLSPACDMVPGRKIQQGLSDCRPFVAVQLYDVSSKLALKYATQNHFLFLDIDNNVETFSTRKNGNLTTNSDWVQFFARNDGKFHDENKLTLGNITENEGELVFDWAEAFVVAQLRSEYALNLLQNIGGQLSRPGLGMNFKSSAV